MSNPVVKDPEEQLRQKMQTIVQLLSLVDVHDTAYYLAQKYDLDYMALHEPITDLSPEHLFTEFEGVDGTMTRFFEYKSFWDSFGEVVNLLKQNGHHLTRNFFATVAGKDGILMNTVCDREDVAASIFKPEYWVGHERDMVASYYLMKSVSQTKVNLEKIRKELAAYEGRECRFYQTKQAFDAEKLIYTDVFRLGDTDKYDAAMHAAGMTPSKEDFFVEVSSGKSLFHDKAHFKNFSKWTKYFAHYGDYFTAEDLTIKFGMESSFLERAISEDVLSDVFHPQCWIDNLEEMKRLWDLVPQDKRSKCDFIHSYTEAEDASYQIELPLDHRLTKEMLFTPVVKHEDNNKSVIPLGLPWVWENFSTIQEILTKKGTPITLHDMHATSGLAEESVAIKAVRFGGLQHFMSLVSPSKGQTLDYESCAHKTSIGSSLIAEVAKRYQLDEFFQPQYWVRNTAAMIKLWGDITDNMAKDHVKDFGALVSMANAMTVRQHEVRRQASARVPRP